MDKTIIINRHKYKISSIKDIDKLIDKFKDNKLNKEDETIYHILCKNIEDKDHMAYLFFKTIDNKHLTLKDKDGWTPLHYFAMGSITGILHLTESATVIDNIGFRPIDIFLMFIKKENLTLA